MLYYLVAHRAYTCRSSELHSVFNVFEPPAQRHLSHGHRKEVHDAVCRAPSNNKSCSLSLSHSHAFLRGQLLLGERLLTPDVVDVDEIPLGIQFLSSSNTDSDKLWLCCRCVLDDGRHLQ